MTFTNPLLKVVRWASLTLAKWALLINEMINDPFCGYMAEWVLLIIDPSNNYQPFCCGFALLTFCCGW